MDDTSELGTTSSVIDTGSFENSTESVTISSENPESSFKIDDLNDSKKIEDNMIIIDTTNLTTEQVKEWTYYHERLFWEKEGQGLVRGDVQYTFEKDENQNLKIMLSTKWQPLGLYMIDENGALFREDPRSGEIAFITDIFDVGII